MIGIYKIITPSNQIYIGQSWDIEKRFNQYKILNCKNQIRIYRSFVKYGVENHKFEIIKSVSHDISQEALDNLEIFYIRQQKEQGFILLNLKSGGKGGGKHSEQSKNLMSVLKLGKPSWNKGKPWSKEAINAFKNARKDKKKIKVFDNFGNFVKDFESISDAGRELNIHCSNISMCLNNKIKQAKGFIFKYKKEKIRA